MDLQALKDELTLDPIARGYAGMSDVAASSNLNTVRDRISDAVSITGGQVASAIVFAEFDAIANADHKQYIAALIAAGDIPVTAALKTSLGSIFAAGTTTRANLIALVPKPSTRAEELGFGRVTESDVANARRL